MERFAIQAVKALNAAEALSAILENPLTVTDLEIPPDPALGDFALPCFRLAKAARKSPPELALTVSQALKAPGKLPTGIFVEASGPYVNFKVDAQTVFNTLLGDLLGTHYGSLPPNSRETWVLEYSSPNVAKPFNIYHLRPTALGAALDRIGRFRGFRVISINHLGDWGTQYGKLAVAFQNFKSELPAEPTVEDLANIYVRFHQEAEKNPALEDDARKAFVKLEAGDPEITALWRQCVEISLKEFNRLYARLGVQFDHIWGESHYKDLLQPLLQKLRESGLLVQSEGAWVVPVTTTEGKELPPCILQKSDGATIYATRDVAAALYRFEKFHFDRLTYIVGGEQKLHFQQVFAVLRKMGHPWWKACEHVPTGLYRFKDAKMSTRKGNFVTLEEVLELAKERVCKLVTERSQKEGAAPLTPSEIENISEKVAIGAVVFHDLHTDPARDVDFDVDRVVDFEGETGPYLQYAHTRCLSILRKARDSGELPSGEVLFDSEKIKHLQKPEEIALTKMLGRFPLHLERSLRFAKASQLATYLIDLTRCFGAFYRECRVLGEAPELTGARLMLVEATRRVLQRGLELLGIPLPEKM